MNQRVDPVSLERLRAVIADDLALVDAVIRSRLTSDVVLINQISQYIVGAGGKRIRPALVLFAGNHFHGPRDSLHELAAVVEFIHTATLLHDDVVDDSSLRRGRNTANAEFGNPAAVLVGDFLYSRAFQMMVAVGSMRVMEIIADATNVIAEGEVLQLLNVHDANVAEDAYLRVVRYKTAKLFEAACRVGAVLGGASAADEQALGSYGMHLGTAFQLIDDVLDYCGNAGDTGKNLGDDLAEGKPTLPLIYAMREGTPAHREAIRRAIETGGRDALDDVIRAITETGALDYARGCAHREASAATECIAGLGSSVYADALIQLCVFAVERRY
ncbi:MAG TPA: polyprenyl synthetase family protein [Usitatibacteraceae bacterium]|nr:polyprenyl synthetase family protein [Usitatibacteraceae bacterium]